MANSKGTIRWNSFKGTMLYEVLSGIQFNELFPTKAFYKLTNAEEHRSDFHYKTGLNADHVAFHPHGECHAGGLYFAEQSMIALWIAGKHYIRRVHIPDNA